MSTTDRFRIIKRENVHQVAVEKKQAHWRCLQMMCTNTEHGLDVTYTYQKDDVVDNLMVKGVQKDEHVQSITDVYIGLFPFENEAHDLFGLQVDDIAIDFQGRFYDLAIPEPMTIISPEKKARMDKARRQAAAKAAKEGKTASGKDLEAERAALEKKLAGMDPEKAAKVRAAFEAKVKREAQKQKSAQDAELEEKLKNMDPEKAAKVRAALEAKKKREAAAKKSSEGEE
ncbi:MAG: NADH-quinone oxidoreductase subunit C [Eggerthellaceae bacterium]|jgi:hypothetical protein